MNIRISRLKLIECIEKFRKEQVEVLAKIKAEEKKYKAAMDQFDKDRIEFALSMIASGRNTTCSYTTCWRNLNAYNITIELDVPKKAIPSHLLEPPKRIADAPTVEREIEEADDKLAALRLCTDVTVCITTKLGQKEYQKYIKPASTH